MLLCLLTRTLPCHAQSTNLQFRHFEEGTPLNGNAIYITRQDTDGYLWFGTYKGLYRYDGYNYKSFKDAKGDLKLLSQGPIEKMIIDHQNCIWALVNGVGLICLDVKSGKVKKKFLVDDLGRKYGLNSILTDVEEDKDYNIWFSARGDGVFRWQASSDRLSQYTVIDSILFTKGRFESIICDEGGNIWFGCLNFGLLF